MEKVCFKDLSVANRIGLVGGWIAIVSNLAYFVVGFMWGLINGY